MASYGIEMTGKEMMCFFFKKKKCPKCEGKMERQKKVESLGEGLDSTKLGEFYYGEKHEVTLYYNCKNCNTVYSLKALAESK